MVFGASLNPPVPPLWVVSVVAPLRLGRMVHRVGERGERNKHIKRVSNTADDLIRVEWNGLGHIEWMVCFNDPYVIVCVSFAL